VRLAVAAGIPREEDSKSLQIDPGIDGPLVDYQEKRHRAELAGRQEN
jgi:hypothetical protein